MSVELTAGNRGPIFAAVRNGYLRLDLLNIVTVPATENSCRVSVLVIPYPFGIVVFMRNIRRQSLSCERVNLPVGQFSFVYIFAVSECLTCGNGDCSSVWNSYNILNTYVVCQTCPSQSVLLADKRKAADPDVSALNNPNDSISGTRPALRA